MSGFLGALAGRADLAASILGIGAAQGLTLGTVTFSDMEIPEQITFGGQQQLTVHKFPGGSRVLDAMGRDDVALTWSGIFIDNADDRARAVDEIRVTGEPVALFWRDFAYSVVVHDFQADTRAFHSPYRITCEVVEDLTASPDEREPTFLQQVGLDINAAAGFNLTGAASTALTKAQQAVSLVSALSGGSVISQQVRGYLGTAQTATITVAAAAGARITASSLATTTDAGAAVSAIQSAIADTGAVAQLRAAAGYLGRAVTNAASGAF